MVTGYCAGAPGCPPWCTTSRSMVHGVPWCMVYGVSNMVHQVLRMFTLCPVFPYPAVVASHRGVLGAGRVCRGEPWTIRYAGLTYNRGCSSLTLECLLLTLCKINSILVCSPYGRPSAQACVAPNTGSTLLATQQSR